MRPIRRRTRLLAPLLIVTVAVTAASGAGLSGEDSDPVAEKGAATIDCGAAGKTVNGICAGTTAANNMVGTSTKNNIQGRGGNDTLAGRGGDDLLNGETGNDKLNGSTGNDTMQGSTGDDQLVGGSGNDRLTDTLGRDTLDGGTGNDVIDGRDGSTKGVDRVTCGAGSDTAYVDLDDVVVDAAACEQLVKPVTNNPEPDPDPEPEPDVPVVTMSFTGGRTDNYKACWNADPAAHERRTWGLFTALVVTSKTKTATSSTTWVAQDADVAGNRLSSVLSMRATSGSATGSLQMRIKSGPISGSQFRTSGGAGFGPLIVVAAKPGFNAPGTIELTLTSSTGAKVATGDVTYAPASSISNQPMPNCNSATGAQLEWNGPGGQFAANGSPWAFNWAGASAAQLSTIKTRSIAAQRLR